MAWGDGSQGATGLSCLDNIHSPRKIEFDVKLMKVSTGINHTAFIDVRGCVHVCGSNSDGQLGLDNKFEQVIVP